MENLDIDQLKKDVDEILELSSKQANEVAQSEKVKSAVTSDPENTQHFLKVHSLIDEESVQAQNRQSQESEKRRTISVTFNEEPEIHVRSQATIQSASGGVIDVLPEINEFGGVNEFTQTGTSLIYAAVESPKEEALRSRSLSLNSQTSKSVSVVDNKVESEQTYPIDTQGRHIHQNDSCQAYKEQSYQPTNKGESALLADIVSLQFEHIPQNPVAFPMLPDAEFLKPETGLKAQKLLFGGTNDETPNDDDSIDFHNSPESNACDERVYVNENCCCAIVDRHCPCPASHQNSNRLGCQAQETLKASCGYREPEFTRDPKKMSGEAYQQQREKLEAPESNRQLELPRGTKVQPSVEMDDCKRSITSREAMRPSRSREQRNFSIISTNSGTTFHRDDETADFMHEPSTEAMTESLRDPGAGNVDFDFYPPLDQRSPIRINIGSKVFVGDALEEIPEFQPGVIVGTIAPEFHLSRPYKAANDEMRRETQKEVEASGNKVKQDQHISFAAWSDGLNASNQKESDHVEEPEAEPFTSKRNFGSMNSNRDQDNIVTMQVDGKTTFFRDDDPLPITPFESSSNLFRKRSKSQMSIATIPKNEDSEPPQITRLGSHFDLGRRRSTSNISASKLPPNVAFDEPMEFTLNNALLMRDLDNINLMSNAGHLLTQSRGQEYREPTINDVNMKIFEAPPRHCHYSHKLAVPTLIKSRDASFEFVEQADALTYRHHASSDPAFLDYPQPIFGYTSVNSLQNAFDGTPNRSTLKRGMAMENLSEINRNDGVVPAPPRRQCNCEKRLMAAMEPNPQKMNFKFAPVPNGVNVMKFIDRRVMESPYCHEPQPMQGQYDTQQEVYQDDYYWTQQNQQNYSIAPNQKLPYSPSMTAVCSFTQLSHGGQNSCYYQPDGAERSRSAVEDDDGYMNLPPQGVSHVASSAWVDDNEMFLVDRQPSLHYHTPLGLGYRDDFQRPPVGAYNSEAMEEVRGMHSKPDGTFHRCKCAFKRLSKLFRKD